MSKYTKGPWEIFETPFGTAIACNQTDKTGNRLFVGHVVMESKDLSDSEQQSNARLIAAAPELLEALKLCLHDDAGGLEPGTVHLAMQAINKALGKE